MKRLINILIIVIELIFGILVLYKVFDFCLIKRIFKVSCPACGLTRSFLSIMSLDLTKAIYYNLLGIPLFIFLVLSNLSLVKDIIKNESKTIEYLNNIFSKYYLIIIIILIITMILNNVHGI